MVQFGKLTTTAYQRLAIRLRIAGLQADVHRVSDESFIKLTHNPKWTLLNFGTACLGNTAEAKNWEFLAPTGCCGVFTARISTSDNAKSVYYSLKPLIYKGQEPMAKSRIVAKLQSQYSKYRTNKASEKCTCSYHRLTTHKTSKGFPRGHRESSNNSAKRRLRRSGGKVENL